jgi:predicted  nucleic acid-binding Zn-ribbon protein
LRNSIELLTSLQRIDQAISDKKREAQEASRQLRDLEAAAAERAAEALRTREASKEVRTRQVAIEGELAELEEKMKDRRMRLQRIRSEKELQATQREIETIKERIGQLEEEELAILEEAEAFNAKVAAAEDNLRRGQEALEAERAQLEAKGAQSVQAASRDEQLRTELAASIDGGLMRRYERIFARRGGTAVVAVREGTCQGCHMHVPPQLYNQILKGEEVFACPSCQRLLFIKPDAPDPAT